MKNLIYFFSKPSLRYWLTKNLIPFLAIILILLPQQGCNTTEPTLKPELALELEDVSCTEAWIKLTTNNIQLPATINLLKNNSISQVYVLNTQDSLLYIDSLLPNQTYKFKVLINTTNLQQPTTNELTVTTFDTTSHEFSWQSWEFGEITNQSTLFDVAIIDENNIWAVGEIYMLDSLGRPDPNAYNAVHWDGTKWELKRIGFPTVCGSQNLTYYPAGSIVVFNDGTIYICSTGDKVAVLKNGDQITQYCLPENVSMSINKLWGSSSEDLYAVGNNGNIAHWDGNSWKKIESATATNINDIWGFVTEQSNVIFYCPVSSFFVPGVKKILKITNGLVDSVLWDKDNRIYSAWAANENILYVCGEGIFVNKFGSCIEIVLRNVGTNSIRGNDVNDIFICGDYGFIAHFNGLNWHVFNNNYLKGYSRVSYKNSTAIIVGNYQGRAIIEIGKRN